MFWVTIPLPSTYIKGDHAMYVDAKLLPTDRSRQVLELVEKGCLTCAISGTVLEQERDEESGITTILKYKVNQIALIPKGMACDPENSVSMIEGDNLNRKETP